MSDHPMTRGFGLAAAVVVAMLMTGQADYLPAYGQISLLTGQTRGVNGFALAMAAMTVIGALLAALPSRLRHAEQDKEPFTARTGLMAALGGLLTVLGIGLAGGGMVAGLLQGSVSAWAFLAAAWATAGLLSRAKGGEAA